MLEGTDEEMRQIAVSLSKVEQPIFVWEKYAKSDESGRVPPPATIEVFRNGGLRSRRTKKELGVKEPGNGRNAEIGQGKENGKVGDGHLLLTHHV